MAAQTSSGLNPIDFSADWTTVEVAGVESPGVIAVDGIQGFERKTGWDIKAGKGTQGATLTLKTMPPAEGSFEFLLWSPEDFDDWQTFRKVLKYNPTRTTPATAADALDIYHPALADLGISRVVTAEVSPVRHKGRGLYTVSVKFIEWQNPPPVSIVATTSSSKTNGDPKTPGNTQNAEAVELQSQIKQAYQTFQQTPVG